MALPRLLVWREEPLLAAGAVHSSTTPHVPHAEEPRPRAPRLQAGAHPADVAAQPKSRRARSPRAIGRRLPRDETMTRRSPRRPQLGALAVGLVASGVALAVEP